MAKGNLFQGMGRGKVGDVVFSRLNGEQVSRVRNRHPKNPRTNKQLIQRAIMATVMSAYSAGREIFDHSFQGYSVGAGCQRRFLSMNANLMRTKLATEWDTAAGEEALVKVTAPGVQTPIPNEYIVAEGSMSQDLFTYSFETGTQPEWQLPAPNANEKAKDYAARVGLNAGDIYTFVFIVTSKEAADVLFKTYGIASVDFDNVYRGAFGWVRLITKNLAADETVVYGGNITALFDIEYGGIASISPETCLIEDAITITSVADSNPDYTSNGYAIGLIKSRRDEDLRSNTSMVVCNPDEFGLYWNDLLTAWKAGTTTIGASDLILEGGDE